MMKKLTYPNEYSAIVDHIKTGKVKFGEVMISDNQEKQNFFLKRRYECIKTITFLLISK